MKTTRIRYCIILLISLLIVGCQWFEQKRMTGAAVELNGRYIFQSTLDSLTYGLNTEDSARVVEQYIAQWAKEILIYEVAKGDEDKEIEALVDDYRRSLYVHKYENELVSNKMSKIVADSVVEQVYKAHPEQFLLKENLLKGALITFPNDAPNQKQLKQWLANLEDAENLEKIEKFAYNYASGYELFLDDWCTGQQIYMLMPLQSLELSKRLRTQNLIEVQDSTSTYLLQITDKRMVGEAMPLDYARPEIEKAVLNQRRVAFLQEEAERLYEQSKSQMRIYPKE